MVLNIKLEIFLNESKKKKKNDAENQRTSKELVLEELEGRA